MAPTATSDKNGHGAHSRQSTWRQLFWLPVFELVDGAWLMGGKGVTRQVSANAHCVILTMLRSKCDCVATGLASGAPRKPGMAKQKIAWSSDNRFSTGVPVNATRTSPLGAVGIGARMAGLNQYRRTSKAMN